MQIIHRPLRYAIIYFSLTYPLRQATYTPFLDFPLLTFDFYLDVVSLTLRTLANIH